MDTQQQIIRAIEDGIRDGVKSKLGAYGGPLDKWINDVLASHDKQFRQLLSEAIDSAMMDTEFRADVIRQFRHKLGSVLVSRFGGELEKQVNALKSDPATRARITLAIDEIIKERDRQPVA